MHLIMNEKNVPGGHHHQDLIRNCFRKKNNVYNVSTTIEIKIITRKKTNMYLLSIFLNTKKWNIVEFSMENIENFFCYFSKNVFQLIWKKFSAIYLMEWLKNEIFVLASMTTTTKIHCHLWIDLFPCLVLSHYVDRTMKQEILSWTKKKQIQSLKWNKHIIHSFKKKIPNKFNVAWDNHFRFWRFKFQTIFKPFSYDHHIWSSNGWVGEMFLYNHYNDHKWLSSIFQKS